MNRFLRVSACIGLVLLAGCGRPDTQALKKLACEHVGFGRVGFEVFFIL
jgi:hypothetical protein